MKYLLLMLMVSTSLATAQDGKTAYTSNCASCHQATGKGIPSAFPPLAGHFTDILAADGRAYAINTVLYGMNGAIKVNGKSYSGVMPALGQLSDADIAAILNHVSTSWKNALPDTQKLFTADEVKAERAVKKTPEQVHELRPKGLK
ncbi:c-type cytochrome [Deinococcus arenicola]|uniref:Cytochrome c n=1 Tax=Deinococcus arenicola TaxID=2994950 RepID=A0ABU4DVV4_9DEIO|nr:cytochrome c [Deinococcus sp. ZS9-10]MDV6376584.1 cytochrome c [Deinococcus sp. ZS9-10]